MPDTSRTTTDLNVRSSPEVSPTNQTDTLLSGAHFEATGNVGLWLQINHGGQPGFVNGDFTTSLQPVAAAPLWTTSVTTPALNLRNQPSMAANSIIDQLTAGDQLNVFGHDQGWLHIRHNAQDGWVACNSTASIATPTPVAQPSQLGTLMQKAKLSTAEINQARQLIHALGNVNERGDKFEALQSKTVYRNQRDNRAIDANGNLVETRSGQMCNLTSLAMCLDYLGIPNPHPAMQYEDALEKVRVDNQLPARTESNGWGGVAVKLGAKVNFLGAGASHDHQWYTNNVLPALRAGHAMMMSICGHIVRVQDVTNEGLIIDDPYGKGRLLPNPGCQDLKWHYASFNEYQTPNQAVGEDNIWAWGDVSTHCMRWIAELSRPLGLPVGPQPVPAVNFSDDGIVVPGQTD